MKLISKFKDYYDFVVRETDNRKVYTRDTRTLKEPDMIKILEDKRIPISHRLRREICELKYEALNKDDLFILCSIWFCDLEYPYVLHKKSEEIYYKGEDLPEEFQYKIKLSYRKEMRNNPVIEWLNPDKPSRKRWDRIKSIDVPALPKLNTILGAAVITRGLDIFNELLLDPRLKDYQFHKVMTAEQAYMALYNWIPYHEPEMPSDPTDMQRFEGQGHDKKSSFRGK